MAELDILLQTLHNVPIVYKYLNENKNKNTLFSNDINQNKSIIEVINSQLSQSQLVSISKLEDYRKKSEEYMAKTEAYKCLGTNDPLPDLITRTNKYLLDLRLAKWITQKQYE
ncbi:unnamed protein product [Rotaria sp. Silwood2]|nr:unnamed protein product [Rotaria sp. Silwood2]CAF4334335.1 unnamed protein product [Rotaria sp. Silwood2]CAF4773356.1 unnamed protein product [Rotaria sp. Silwood2]